MRSRTSEPGGCRVVVEVLPLSAARAATLRRHGFSLVRGAADGPAAFTEGEAPVCLPGGRQWWHAGRVPVTAPRFQLDLDFASSPFTLPTPWSVRPVLRPGSRFAAVQPRVVLWPDGGYRG